jgi:L-amino acid N-acyltransferase YncA
MDAELIMVRAAVPADLPDVAAISAHYVTTSVTAFEEVPPAHRKHGRWIDTVLMQRERA